MRFACRYRDSENSVAQLNVEHLVDNEWQVFDLNAESPGFSIFVYAILNCQHLYCRTNAAERGLVFERAQGEIALAADEDWRLQKVHVDVEAQLRTGQASDDDVAFIIERMKQCPVSRNLNEISDAKTTLQFL